ncbi:MAG: 4-hydroxythreonine-4-phosphate dehydrogenase PdxA [Myxococcales bacterium]|nr:4-hydroxythreonine-4-phosphate dehydrogenase PdxA [Myxococcales bacterium]
MRIGITLGDPAGVGPELIVRALAAGGGGDAIVFGDAGVLERAAEAAGVPSPEACGARVEAVTRLAEVQPGRPTPEGGAAQVAYLEAAMVAARRGEIAALVTAPIHKAAVIAAGFAFPGHTEFLAARLGVRRVAMMLAGPHLRVVPATTHIALADVPRALTVDGIAHVCALTLSALAEQFGIARPRVAVCGLNPHAGESGHFGDEEARVIAPAIAAVAEGPLAERFEFELSGPHVPDAIFRTAAAPPFGAGRHDAVVAMYHDQGLIPLKLIDFDEAVNLTLGLPLVRTSPDHGVAYDIAGTGRVREGSFRAALRMARDLAGRRTTAAS